MQTIKKDYRLISLMVDDVNATEMKRYRLIRLMLFRKIEAKSFTIDMPKLKDHFGMSEGEARKLINRFEFYEEPFGTKFIIINGSEAWKEDDAVRLAQVQKGVAG